MVVGELCTEFGCYEAVDRLEAELKRVKEKSIFLREYECNIVIFAVQCNTQRCLQDDSVSQSDEL